MSNSNNPEPQKCDWTRQDKKREHRQQKSRRKCVKRRWQVKKASQEAKDCSTSLDDEIFGQVVRNLKQQIKMVQINDSSRTVTNNDILQKIEDIDVHVEPYIAV